MKSNGSQLFPALSWEIRTYMDDDYKGHHIEITPRHLPNSRWAPHVQITWTSGSREQRREFNIERGFVTENDAEWEGLRFARKWISNGKPD